MKTLSIAILCSVYVVLLAASDETSQAWIGLIGLVVTNVVSVVLAYIALRNRMLDIEKKADLRSVQHQETNTKIEGVQTAVADIQHTTNSMQTELVHATKLAGILEGANQEKLRVAGEQAAAATAVLAERDRLEAEKRTPPQ